MKYHVADADGAITTLPLFPTITDASESYTFRSPTGLLNATQFTQPALTLMQKARRPAGTLNPCCAQVWRRSNTPTLRRRPPMEPGQAAFDSMKHQGLVRENSAFAGHSLGEYAALAAIGQVLPIEALVDVVFYRGMTMQVRALAPT